MAVLNISLQIRRGNMRKNRMTETSIKAIKNKGKRGLRGGLGAAKVNV